MTVYQMMTMAIESYTEGCIEFEKDDGHKCFGVRGMIDGVKQVRDQLTVEAAECEC